MGMCLSETSNVRALAHLDDLAHPHLHADECDHTQALWPTCRAACRPRMLTLKLRGFLRSYELQPHQHSQPMVLQWALSAQQSSGRDLSNTAPLLASRPV